MAKQSLQQQKIKNKLLKKSNFYNGSENLHFENRQYYKPLLHPSCNHRAIRNTSVKGLDEKVAQIGVVGKVCRVKSALNIKSVIVMLQKFGLYY